MSQDFLDNKPMLRLSFGGTSFVLPWEAGVQVLNLMRDAQSVDPYYMPDSYEGSWRRSNASIGATAFTPEEQAKLMMEGA